MAHIRIGLPRALLYHKYGTAWAHFFRSLGCQVITSPQTNRQILEQGLHYSVDETCMAVKIYLGHIHYLIGKVDYLFIPRLVSLYRDEEACVKLFALADIVRNTFANVKILEYTVDVPNHYYEVCGAFKIGMQLTYNPVKVLRAYCEGMTMLVKQKRVQLDNQRAKLAAQRPSVPRILLVAHSYVLHDALMGKTVMRLLRDQGIDVLCSDIVDEQAARSLSCNLSTDLYWTYNKELLGAIEIYKPIVDGIIILMAFPCGPDSLVGTLCQHRIVDTPLCILTMDELQADAGIKTRLESFIDIIQFKKERGDAKANSYLPAYGELLHRGENHC